MPSLTPFNFFQGGLPDGDYTSTGIFGDVWYRVIGESHGNFPEGYTILRFREFAENNNLTLNFSGDLLPAQSIDVSSLNLDFGGELFTQSEDKSSYDIGFSGRYGDIGVERTSYLLKIHGSFGTPYVDRSLLSLGFSGDLIGTKNDRIGQSFSFSAMETGVTARDTQSFKYSFHAGFKDYFDDTANIMIEFGSGFLYRDATQRRINVEDSAMIEVSFASCKLYTVG